MLLRVLFLLLLNVALSGAAQGVRVVLRSSAEVAPGMVRLGDIAEITGDSSLVRRLSALEVAKVDRPGRETRVSANAVKSFFVRAVVDPSLVEFAGEGSVKVRARAGSVDADAMEKLLLEQVRPRMVGLEEGADWELEPGGFPKSVDIPEQGGRVVMELSPRFAGIGQETATLKVFDGDKMLSSRHLAYKLHRWENVVRLRKALRKGESVRAEDVELVREETTFQQRKILRTLEDAVGRNTLRAVREGDLLVDNWLETPYAVREGDRIRLWVQVGGAVVQTVAVAQANAFRGQTIAVENADSRKVLQAKVSGAGEAWVIN